MTLDELPPVDAAARAAMFGERRCAVCGQWIREEKRRGAPRQVHVECLPTRERNKLEKLRRRRAGGQ